MYVSGLAVCTLSNRPIQAVLFRLALRPLPSDDRRKRPALAGGSRHRVTILLFNCTGPFPTWSSETIIKYIFKQIHTFVEKTPNHLHSFEPPSNIHRATSDSNRSPTDTLEKLSPLAPKPKIPVPHTPLHSLITCEPNPCTQSELPS
ncbi:hypothetical protein PtA15_9A378 [Puccinia triticina]|uniref:Uncharacterized protein n=1 Tax=Puccinia triticina TaxID=208348 RepID=A0ABY7CSL8_9BASI|nr:uncharacterized protein PtA15_9A378 [Puccinia triticina]WAQ88251.1 hypothetical protein PtA15_9A378 [Puccinia triticina]